MLVDAYFASADSCLQSRLSQKSSEDSGHATASTPCPQIVLVAGPSETHKPYKTYILLQELVCLGLLQPDRSLGFQVYRALLDGHRVQRLLGRASTNASTVLLSHTFLMLAARGLHLVIMAMHVLHVRVMGTVRVWEVDQGGTFPS